MNEGITYWEMTVNTFSISFLNLFGPSVYSSFMMTELISDYISWGGSKFLQLSPHQIDPRSISGWEPVKLEDNFKLGSDQFLLRVSSGREESCKLKEGYQESSEKTERKSFSIIILPLNSNSKHF